MPNKFLTMKYSEIQRETLDVRKFLLLIKGEDKTNQVVRVARRDGRIAVTYRTGKTYHYSACNVEYFTTSKNIPIAGSSVSIREHLVYDVTEILRFGDWARVFRGRNKIMLCRFRDISLQPIKGKSGLNQDLLSYYKELAAGSSLKNEDGSTLLAKKFETLRVVNRNSILFHFLKGKAPENAPLSSDTSAKLIFPFGCNMSQKHAVARAFENPVSVIQGPPGTGKTQTILNLIANLLLQGKRIAIVSSNNSATANVLEKLEKSNLDFIAAFLGSSSNKQTFINNQSSRSPELPSLSSKDLSNLQLEVSDLNSKLTSAFNKKNELADALQKLSALKLELKHFEQYESKLFDPNAREKKVSILTKASAQKLMRHWLLCERKVSQIGERNGVPRKYHFRAGPIEKIKLRFQLGRAGRALFNVPITERIPLIQKAYYLRKIGELERRTMSLKRTLDHFHFDEQLKKLSEVSMRLLKHHLSRKYNSRPRKIFELEDLWKNPKQFLDEYPVIMSTTFSVITSVRKGYRFDCVIVDEASQVDLLNGVLTMSCAEQLVVVGDMMQLPNVLPDDDRQRAFEVGKTYEIPAYAQFEKHSLLSSISEAFAGIPKTLLREHYRCHPKIIQFCNQKFYNDELVVMTEDQDEDGVLKAYLTVEGNHARGAINQRQIDEIIHHVLPELGDVPPENIGIVSPYRAQTDQTHAFVGSSGIEVDTVHKYQGREKPIMIITTVANQANSFVDDANLLNVAISRAQYKLRIIASKQIAEGRGNIAEFIRYIRYSSGEVIPGRVRSVFDLLYSDYTQARLAALKNTPRISEYDSENLLYHEIRELLNTSFKEYQVAVQVPLSMLIQDDDHLTDEERAYAHHPWTKTDFLVYGKIDKRPKLVIEVDGYAYHKEGTAQFKRDGLKNSVLQKSGLPLLRLSTTGSSERSKIASALKDSV